MSYGGSAGRTFTPVERPPESAGPTRAAAADLVMQTRGSRFIKFQEVRIQELAGEVRRPCMAEMVSPAWACHVLLLLCWQLLEH
jgi:DNA replicative helicase MCM subunit Mcm2 (Cdc46/Mcm family)